MEDTKTPAEKKAILLKHYDFTEICDIIGWNDESNEDVCTPEMEELAVNDFSLFTDKILDAAIINGNFEEVIEHDERLPI